MRAVMKGMGKLSRKALCAHKGTLSFVCASPARSPPAAFGYLLFQAAVKSCVKDWTPLISYVDIFDHEMLHTAILPCTTEPREKSQKILKWKRPQEAAR